MRRCLFMVILVSLIAQPNMFSQKIDLLYKKALLQLPNEEVKRGEIWMIGNIDSTRAIYFRKHSGELPLKYEANELVWFELVGSAKKYLSVPIRVEETKETRRYLAELQFDGEYKLLSVIFEKESVYYLVDRAGELIPLFNSYTLPGPDNNYKVTYSYEFRSELARIFGDAPNIETRVKDIHYNQKSLTSFLLEYHALKGLPGSAYPIPGTGFSAVASAGFADFRSIEEITGRVELGTSMASLGVSGEFWSTRMPLFGRAGFTLFKGYQQEDLGGIRNVDYMIYTEIISSSLLARFDVSGGFSFLKKNKISPYLMFGVEYFAYLSYNRERIEEVINRNFGVMVTEITTSSAKPDNFSALRFELGASYKVNVKSSLRCAASYHRFTEYNRKAMWISGIDLTVSYVYKLF